MTIIHPTGGVQVLKSQTAGQEYFPRDRPHHENPLRSPLVDVVHPRPRAEVEPRHGEEDVHFLEVVITEVGHDSSRRVPFGSGQGSPRLRCVSVLKKGDGECSRRGDLTTAHTKSSGAYCSILSKR